MDDIERRASARIRALRRASYRCHCGAFASRVCLDPDTGEYIAACLTHLTTEAPV